MSELSTDEVMSVFKVTVDLLFHIVFNWAFEIGKIIWVEVWKLHCSIQDVFDLDAQSYCYNCNRNYWLLAFHCRNFEISTPTDPGPRKIVSSMISDIDASNLICFPRMWKERYRNSCNDEVLPRTLVD